MKLFFMIRWGYVLYLNNSFISASLLEEEYVEQTNNRCSCKIVRSRVSISQVYKINSKRNLMNKRSELKYLINFRNRNQMRFLYQLKT